MQMKRATGSVLLEIKQSAGRVVEWNAMQIQDAMDEIRLHLRSVLLRVLAKEIIIQMEALRVLVLEEMYATCARAAS
jgi:hypothetical protein